MTDADEKAFNERFRARVAIARREAGLTQPEVANLLGIPVETYRKYETRSMLPMFYLVKLSAVLDRPLSYFLAH